MTPEVLDVFEVLDLTVSKAVPCAGRRRLARMRRRMAGI